MIKKLLTNKIIKKIYVLILIFLVGILFLLLFKVQHYEFSVRPILLKDGSKLTMVITSQCHLFSCGSPYQTSIVISSKEKGQKFDIKNLKITKDKLLLKEVEKVSIIANEPESVLRDNSIFIGYFKLPSLNLEHKPITTTLEIEGETQSQSLLLKPYIFTSPLSFHWGLLRH